MCPCKQPEIGSIDKYMNLNKDKAYFCYGCKRCMNTIPHHELILKDYSIEKEIKEIIAKGKYEDYYITGLYKNN